MKKVFAADKDNPRLKEYIGLLYDQALLLEGDRPRDPVAFSESIARLMAEGAEK
jgi:molecular chaperone HtpG